MSRTPLDGLDLNLLVTLRALLQEVSVTRAASLLGQTQPTVSRALGTLRTAMGDELLVRSGRGMVLTPLGEALRPALERALTALDRLPEAGAFDPATDRRAFRIVLPDLLGAELLPALVRRLGDAPGVTLEVLGSERDLARELLAERVDLSVGALEVADAAFRSEAIASIGWRLVHAEGSPCPDVDAWLAAPHVKLIPAEEGGTPGHLDAFLAARGASRQVPLHVSYLAALPGLLAGGPFVCTRPAAAARWVATREGVQVSPHPLGDELPRLPVCSTWHAAREDDAAHRWLRARVA
ncbi:MAG: LysR family transcriptional regulator, partial [Myxococcota bacterium]